MSMYTLSSHPLLAQNKWEKYTRVFYGSSADYCFTFHPPFTLFYCLPSIVDLSCPINADNRLHFYRLAVLEEQGLVDKAKA
jgi:hypothetical protein